MFNEILKFYTINQITLFMIINKSAFINSCIIFIYKIKV